METSKPGVTEKAERAHTPIYILAQRDFYHKQLYPIGFRSFCIALAALAPTCGSAEVNATISGDCAATL